MPALLRWIVYFPGSNVKTGLIAKQQLEASGALPGKRPRSENNKVFTGSSMTSLPELIARVYYYEARLISVT